MMLSVFLHVVGAFGSAFAPNYAAFVALRFLVGMSNLGIFLSAFVIGKWFLKHLTYGIQIEGLPSIKKMFSIVRVHVHDIMYYTNISFFTEDWQRVGEPTFYIGGGWGRKLWGLRVEFC